MRPYRGFAEMIRHRRKELDMTLSQVASQMDWSVPYVSEIERGVKQPPPEEGVRRLAGVLKLDEKGLVEEATMSRRSIEIDLEGVGATQRQLALILARRFGQGLSEKQAQELIEKLQSGELERPEDDL